MTESIEAEFTAFVTDRGPALVRVAYTLTGDQQTAEDLVQSALAKAFTRWPRLRDDPEPYIRRIIYNDRVSFWRRQGRRGELLVADMPEPGVQDHDTTLRLGLRIAMRKALLALPPRQRAVLVLRYLEDRSVEETAEVLGCRPGTVASQANRALSKLRRMIPELNDANAAEVLR